LQRHLKAFRLLVSVFVLVAVGFLFLDFRATLPSEWFRGLTWLQFVPSLSHFFQALKHGWVVTAYGFLVVLLLSLLFGRVYCSFLCPLGVLKDVLGWFSAKLRKKKRRFRFAPPKTWLRYSILLAVGLSLLANSFFLVSLLDPYSNFGRFLSGLFRPAYMLGNNLLATTLEALGSYALFPSTLPHTPVLALLLPGAMLLLVVWLAVKKGRLYCNTVCPVGALLGLLAKRSLFQIRFHAADCNRCGNCVFACKAQCIDIRNHRVDFGRCVGCGNCIRACSQNGIRYSLAFAYKPKGTAGGALQGGQKGGGSSICFQKASTPPPPLDTPEQRGHNTPPPPLDTLKRRFILGGTRLLAVVGGLSLKKVWAQNRPHKKDETLPRGRSRVKLLPTHLPSPPGSLAREHFAGACTACHLCVSACPTGVLRPSFLEYGFSGMMQPFMDYSGNFCNYECKRCTEICPSGALVPLSVEEKQTTQVGVVRFERENCVVVSEGTSCGACSEHCPTKAVRMVAYRGELTLPETEPDICIGCGACEYACPVTPYKAIVVDGLPRHQRAQKPEEEALKEKPLEEFPF